MRKRAPVHVISRDGTSGCLLSIPKKREREKIKRKPDFMDGVYVGLTDPVRGLASFSIVPTEYNCHCYYSHARCPLQIILSFKIHKVVCHS